MVEHAARRFLSRSPRATEALAQALGERLTELVRRDASRRGALVLLDGELGSGKTCFVRGLARGLGVVDRVSSPTYALMASYAGTVGLDHFDAYMEGRERAFLLDGGLDCLASGGVAAIEWASRVKDVLPLPRVAVELAHEGESERSLVLRVEGSGRAADELAAAIASLPAGDELEEAHDGEEMEPPSSANSRAPRAH